MMIITDTAADIMEQEAAKMNIQMVPIDIIFGDIHCPRNTPEAYEQFYSLLTTCDELPSTSQPSPQDYLDLYEEAEAKQEEVVVITISSGLSGTYNSAMTAKQICEYSSIYIVDSHQAIIPQRILVERAVQLRNAGYGADEIVTALEHLRDRIEVCGVLDTLTYLKKGGRVPASIATLGNILGIKPVVALLDKVVTSIGKARSMKAAKELLWKQYDKCNIDPDYPVYFGYTLDRKPVEEFRQESIQNRNLTDTRIYPVGGSVGTHLGPGAVLLAFVSADTIGTEAP